MKHDEALKIAQQGLTHLTDTLKQGHSETLRRYLDVLARFHDYSFHNTLLIVVQRPDATHVAGFQTWKKLGRHVRKSEHGIAVLAPMIGSRKESEEVATGQDELAPKVLYGFKVVYVFDVSQTEGEPLPEFARVTGNPGEWLSRLEQAVREHGIELDYRPLPKGIKGASQHGRIVVRHDLDCSERFAVLAHELAHELVHQRTGRTDQVSQTVRETEAEAVAYTVCRALGVDSTTRSSDYIQLYRGDAATLAESLEVIQQAAAELIQCLKASLNRTHASLPNVATAA